MNLDTHGGFGRASDEDLADAFNLAESLANDFVTDFINVLGGHGVGGHGQDHDGGVRRIVFSISGRAGEIDGKIVAGSVDGGLHVARGAIHVPVQVKLQGDGGAAESADRSHFRD